MKKLLSMIDQVKEYLAYRRALGFRLKVEGGELLRFAKYADSVNHRGPVSTELALRWAQLPQNVSTMYRARRLEVVRCFARYQSVYFANAEIPPNKLLGPAHCRPSPFIYSEEQIGKILDCAKQLSPIGGLRPLTYRTLFGLLASTGLRISEALRLERNDVDLKQEILRIRETKFHKSRLVLLDPSVTEVLNEYAHFRDAYRPGMLQPAMFFIGENGKALGYSTVRSTFGRIVDRLGWKSPSGKRPRLYDFRHTFVCRVLLRWHRDGVDVNQAIASLATYVGHVKPTDTYWYVTGIPELMAITAIRFEKSCEEWKGATDETSNRHK